MLPDFRSSNLLNTSMPVEARMTRCTMLTALLGVLGCCLTRLPLRAAELGLVAGRRPAGLAEHARGLAAARALQPGARVPHRGHGPRGAQRGPCVSGALRPLRALACSACVAAAVMYLACLC